MYGTLIPRGAETRKGEGRNGGFQVSGVSERKRDHRRPTTDHENGADFFGEAFGRRHLGLRGHDVRV